MSESSSTYEYRISMVDEEFSMKRRIPHVKGAVIVVHLEVINFYVTKIRTSDGRFLKVGDYERINTPPLRVKFAISTSLLKDGPTLKRYILSKLANYNLHVSTCNYVAKKIICYVYRLASTRGTSDHEDKAFKIDGKLGVIREDVFDEKHVLGGLKKEKLLQCGDDELSCAVCLEELSGESECRRTPCSHVFHYHCILPWLVKNKSCSICRRIIRH